MLIIFIFALLGVELFAGKMGNCLNTTLISPLTTESTEVAVVEVATGSFNTPRDACLATSPVFVWQENPENFDRLGDGISTIYIIFVGENWNEVWHQAYAHTGWVSTFFFVLALLVGQFILLNLFLGILLSNFQFDDDVADGVVAESDIRTSLARSSERSPSRERSPNMADEEFTHELTMARLSSDLRKQTQQEAILRMRILWGVGNARWRRKLLALVDHPYLETCVILAIIVSSASLALDNPRHHLDEDGYWQPDPQLSHILGIVDVLCSVFFTLEALMKIGALGLYAHSHAYLRDNWNLIDVAVVFVSWLSIALGAAKISSGGVRALRALRVLRPIRLVNRVASMRIVVNSIFLAIPGVANVAALLGFFLLVFAILGVQFFGGKLGNCEIASVTNRSSCEATTAVLLDRRTMQLSNRTAIWYNPDIGSFDDVLSAMLVLFEMITAEMWPEVLHLQIDSYAVDKAPVERSSIWIGRLYCFLWTFLGTLLVGNLFIGVLIDNFDKLRGDERGRGTLTPAQMNWVAVQNMVISTKPARRPARPSEGSRRRQRVYDLVMSRVTDTAITALTIANTISLAVPHFQQASSCSGAHPTGRESLQTEPITPLLHPILHPPCYQLAPASIGPGPGPGEGFG